MAYASSRTLTEPAPSGTNGLFKPDRPRAIDRHIDFFGDREGVARDMCGEAFLDALIGPIDTDAEVYPCDD
jgi:hypothetical protein